MLKKIVFILVVFATMCGMHTSCFGQKLYYSEADAKEYTGNTEFTLAKWSDRILIWTFNRGRKTITAKLFDTRMGLLYKATLKPDDITNFITMSPFHETHGGELVLQYQDNDKYITRLLSYDSVTNSITAGNILNQ